MGLVYFLTGKTNKYSKVNSQITQLFVDKKYIKRLDTKSVVQLKGVSTMTFVYNNYKIEELITVLNKVKSWKINLLGIFINPKNLKGREEELDQVIKWAKDNHIYVYLMPAVNIHDKTISELDQVKDFPEMMDKLASRYLKEKNIIYGLWAEPRNVIWPQWKLMAQKIANKIIDKNPEALILLTGVQFGRFFDKDDNIFSFKNIVYDFHDYPAANKKELEPILKYKEDFLWTSLMNKYPVLIGEFGGTYLEDFSSNEDIEYIKKVLADVNKNNLNYTAYTLDEEGGLGLIDWKTGLPTTKGKIIKDDLQNYPPTDFSK